MAGWAGGENEVNPYQLQYYTRQAADGTWTVLSWGKPFMARIPSEELARLYARNLNESKAEAERNGEIEQ